MYFRGRQYLAKPLYLEQEFSAFKYVVSYSSVLVNLQATGYKKNNLLKYHGSALATNLLYQTVSSISQ
jgi:hypothetical protein